VPFFLEEGAAVCRGRGEQVERIGSPIPLHFVVVKPPADLSTADVYRTYDAIGEAGRDHESSRIEDAAAALRGGRLLQLAAAMRNMLQGAAARLTPWIEQARAAFAELDFLAHQLSGSGSAYFGLCRHARHAHRLASVLKTRGVGLVYSLRSCP
jgi:4-diphosphocytidyl-2-C-methyl-D-erythritol kinase